MERNNHGHAVIAALRESGAYLLSGKDDKHGFLTLQGTKALLYDELAQAVREEALVIRDAETSAQLASVDAVSLRAPEGLQDDRAMALALAWNARERGDPYVEYVPIPPPDFLGDNERLRKWW